MAKVIQIRDVPEALHRQLKARAALAGVSLSDHLLDELRRLTEQPALDELRARLRGRAEATLAASRAGAARTGRDHT